MCLLALASRPYNDTVIQYRYDIHAPITFNFFYFLFNFMNTCEQKRSKFSDCYFASGSIVSLNTSFFRKGQPYSRQRHCLCSSHISVQCIYGRTGFVVWRQTYLNVKCGILLNLKLNDVTVDNISQSY